jgi:hypothetical protein
MAQDDTLLNQLRDYLKKEYDISSENIERSSSLCNDLKIYGDDVDEFFSNLIKEFKIEVKQLDLSRFYLGDENLDFFSPLIRFFKGESKNKKPTIVIADIERFIQTGILQ